MHNGFMKKENKASVVGRNLPQAFWILRYSSLGDVVIMSAAVEWLHQHFPKHPIYFITAKEYAPLFKHDTRIKQVYALDRNSGLKGFLKFVRQTLSPEMKKHGGCVIDLHRTIRSTLTRKLCPLPTSFVIQKHTFKRILMCLTKLNVLKKRNPLAVEVVEGLKKVFHETGIDPHPIKPTLHASPAPSSVFREPSASSSSPTSAYRLASSAYIGLVPSAQWPGKRWPPTHFVELIRLIQQNTPYQCVVFGGPNDTHCTQIAESSGSINLTGKLSLEAVIDTIKHKCNMIIANDTGLMHIADALNIPTCAIFGPTSWEMAYPPLGERSLIATRKLLFQPCSRNGSAPCIRFNKRTCLTDLKPMDVFQRCKQEWGW